LHGQTLTRRKIKNIAADRPGTNLQNQIKPDYFAKVFMLAAKKYGCGERLKIERSACHTPQSSRLCLGHPHIQLLRGVQYFGLAGALAVAAQRVGLPVKGVGTYTGSLVGYLDAVTPALTPELKAL